MVCCSGEGANERLAFEWAKARRGRPVAHLVAVALDMNEVLPVAARICCLQSVKSAVY